MNLNNRSEREQAEQVVDGFHALTLAIIRQETYGNPNWLTIETHIAESFDKIKKADSENELLSRVADCRCFVLDTAQQIFEGSQSWQFMRKRLLRCFGERGLEGKLEQILNGKPERNGK